MTNKEKLSKMSDAAAGELLANNCYDNFIRGLCRESCSECYTIWLSSEVEENETSESN